MNDRALDVVECMLTARLYDRHTNLDENDLPPAIRMVLWSGDGVSRPPRLDEDDVTEATGIDDPWEQISGQMFTDRDTFSGQLDFTDDEMAIEWFAERADEERIQANPVLAYHFREDDRFDVLVRVELGSVVRGDRPETCRVPKDQASRLPDRFRGVPEAW